jgi:hypothetical protein
MLLIAVAAACLAAIRSAHAERDRIGVRDQGRWLNLRWDLEIESAASQLGAATALLIAGACRPRRGRRGRFGTPGAVACASIVLFTVVRNLTRTIYLWLRLPGARGLSDSLYAYLIVANDAGFSVLAAWFALVLAGRWRPEPTWVDRTGRVLGLFSIVFTILLRCGL